MKKTGLLAALLACLVMVVSGCGSQSTGSSVTDSSPSPVQEIRIIAQDNVFEPASYTAGAGMPARLVVVNSGRNVHEVEVKGLVSETKLSPGQGKTVDIAVLATGTYRIYCEIHEDENMTGELVVK